MSACCEMLSNSVEPDGWLYFAASADEVLVGFTARSVRMRAERLNSTVPGGVSLLGCKAGTAQDLEMFRAAYHEYRRNGDWFAYDGEVKEFIQSHAKPVDVVLMEGRKTRAKARDEVRLNVNLERGLYERFSLYCDKNGKSMSESVRQLVCEVLGESVEPEEFSNE